MRHWIRRGVLLLCCLLLLGGCAAPEHPQPEPTQAPASLPADSAAPVETEAVPEEPTEEPAKTGPVWLSSQTYELSQAVVEAFADESVELRFEPLAALSTLTDLSSTCVLCRRMNRQGTAFGFALVFLNAAEDGSLRQERWAPISLAVPELGTTQAAVETETTKWSLAKQTRPDRNLLYCFEDAVRGTEEPIYTPLLLLAERSEWTGTAFCLLCRAEQMTPDADSRYVLLYLLRDWSWSGSILSVKTLDPAAYEAPARPILPTEPADAETGMET